MASHCLCLIVPAGGDVVQVLVSGVLTLLAQRKAVTSPPDSCRFAGPDPTVSLHKTNKDYDLLLMLPMNRYNVQTTTNVFLP